MEEMKVKRIYNNINDKTWVLQIIICCILMLIYRNNRTIWTFICKFSIDPNLKFAITGIVNFIIIRLFVLFLSWIIYKFTKP